MPKTQKGRTIAAFSNIIKDLSGPYNIVIGLIYCIVPYIITIPTKFFKLPNDTLILVLAKMFAYAICIAAILNAYIINQIAASITVRNKSFHKYLYPMFFGNKSMDLRTKLKMDSFIARLHKQFIGYECFNLFKFTKLSFYQYILTIVSTYILISNVLK